MLRQILAGVCLSGGFIGHLTGHTCRSKASPRFVALGRGLPLYRPHNVFVSTNISPTSPLGMVPAPTPLVCWCFTNKHVWYSTSLVFAFSHKSCSTAYSSTLCHTVVISESDGKISEARNMCSGTRMGTCYKKCLNFSEKRKCQIPLKTSVSVFGGTDGAGRVIRVPECAQASMLALKKQETAGRRAPLVGDQFEPC